MIATKVAIIGAVATSPSFSLAASATSPPRPRGLNIATFIPLPKTALVDGEIIFTPLAIAAKASV